jgi:hypothetical protein
MLANQDIRRHDVQISNIGAKFAVTNEDARSVGRKSRAVFLDRAEVLLHH